MWCLVCLPVHLTQPAPSVLYVVDSHCEWMTILICNLPAESLFLLVDDVVCICFLQLLVGGQGIRDDGGTRLDDQMDERN